MKTFFYAILLFFLFSCSGVPEGFKKYDSEHFSINYPEAWENSSGKDEILAVFSIKDEDIQKINPSITVSSGKNEDDEDILERSALILKESIPDYQEIFLDKGNPSRIVFKGKLNDFSCIWDVSIYKGKTDYFVTGLCEEKDYSKMKSVFEVSVKSFKAIK
ncbi:MAG: hypothetical protein KBH06_12665 [Spirochaetes bacterium]|nr:hypothetical protein [Spirochaetota bacterium]MBP9024049.1 hypothetical protein [Spirochaetota bacterium]